MIDLFSYPRLYGLADNNPYGLKIFAFLRLCGLAFRQEHIFDASQAPRGQLPYIDDDGTIVGDSGCIVAHLTERYALAIDSALNDEQRALAHCIDRALDDLYWVVSYSRWKDPAFWPLFRDAMLQAHPALTKDGMETAQAYNFERYRCQGIGRYEPGEVYHRGVADLGAIATLLNPGVFVFGAAPSGIDASLYGFIANILFYPIDTPLRRFVLSEPRLKRHCEAMDAIVRTPDGSDQSANCS